MPCIGQGALRLEADRRDGFATPQESTSKSRFARLRRMLMQRLALRRSCLDCTWSADPSIVSFSVSVGSMCRELWLT